MIVAEIKFSPLTKSYWFDPNGLDLKINEMVVVKTELGLELGEVAELKKINSEMSSLRDIKPVIRKANNSDLQKVAEKKEHLEADFKIAKELIEKNDLEMKIVDMQYSFDGGRITFYFTAPARIDFRNLVKDLTHHFQKSIRLFQIGLRDEAKSLGEIGSCGKKLCCKVFSERCELINANYVNGSQIIHRGNERLTGICGKLKCCAKFEQKTYEQLAKNLPVVGSVIATPQGKGTVIKQFILKEAVEIALLKDPETKIEIKI
ncbi:MAG TPA: regulatory iron-sulfur-containing complex subunit RicT [bacterium]|nr:regulatory iron-sulfur-containing complex subunit RicT [bacterium]